jgi:hypothetical protein
VQAAKSKTVAAENKMYLFIAVVEIVFEQQGCKPHAKKPTQAEGQFSFLAKMDYLCRKFHR